MNKHLKSKKLLLALETGDATHLLNGREEIPMTFKDFANTYQWPNMGSLRKMAYESETNGLSQAFIKFKKRRLVLPQTLFRLLKGGSAK